MLPKTTFIYVLKDPETLEVRYVGKSDNPQKRLVHHKSESRKGRSHREHWLSSVLSRGLVPHLEIEDEVLDSEWPSWEVAYISFFRELGCDLVNGTAGGECGPSRLGVKDSPETLAKKRAAASREMPLACILQRTAPCSEKTRKRLRVLNSGENNPRFGIKESPEAGAKRGAAISAAKKGVPQTPEHREANRRAKIGRRASKETRLKMSEAHRGENHPMFGEQHSAESRANMSAAHLGKPWSEKRRAAYEKKYGSRPE